LLLEEVFITVSSPPINWCVVGILAQYGCRRIIQVDAAHQWWLRRCKSPFHVNRFEYPEKANVNNLNINRGRYHLGGGWGGWR